MSQTPSLFDDLPDGGDAARASGRPAQRSGTGTTGTRPPARADLPGEEPTSTDGEGPSRRRERHPGPRAGKGKGPSGLHLVNPAGSDLTKGTHLVLFSAPWCPATGLVASAMTDIRALMRRGTRTGWVDVDSAAHLADRWRVQAVPTVVAICDGVEQGRLIGAGCLRDLPDLAALLAPRSR